MTENSFVGLQVASWLSILLIFLGLVLAFKGRAELLLGAYLATSWQIPPVLELGDANVSVIWVLVPLLGVAVWRFNKKFHPQIHDRSIKQLLLWLSLWSIWIGALTISFPTDEENLRTLASILFLHMAIPLSVLTLFSADFQLVRKFAVAFVVVNLLLLPHILMTLFAVSTLRDLLLVLDQPWWQASGIYVNYHAFGQTSAVSILFVVALMMDRQIRSRLVISLLAVALALMAYLLVISGSRQYMLGVLLAGPIMGLWLLRDRLQQKSRVVASLTIVAAVMFWLASYVPDYFRLSELSVGEGDVGYLAYRPAIYAQMWDWWLKSPLFGNGLFYEYRLSHNLFLDALAAEGLLGFVFLLGLLYFFLRCTKGTWQASPQSSVAVWRIAAFLVFAIGFISAFVSGSVLTADVMYVGGTLIWRLSKSTQSTIGGNSNAAE